MNANTVMVNAAQTRTAFYWACTSFEGVRGFETSGRMMRKGKASGRVFGEFFTTEAEAQAWCAAWLVK